MSNLSKHELIAGLKVLASSWPTKLDISDKTLLMIWYEALKDLTVAEWHHAITVAVRNEQFFPAISRLRALAGKAKDPSNEPVSPEALARQIAEDLYDAVCRFGWPNEDRANKTLSPACKHVIRSMGGWSRLCEIEGEVTVIKAQLRELARAELELNPSLITSESTERKERAKREIEPRHELPQLPEHRPAEQLDGCLWMQVIKQSLRGAS